MSRIPSPHASHPRPRAQAGEPQSPGYVSQLAVATSLDGSLIFFTMEDFQLSVWLPSGQPEQWTQHQFPVAGFSQAPVVSFDMISNCGQGRNDDSIDLLVIAAPDGTSDSQQACYMPALGFSTDPGTWAGYFANAMRLSGQLAHVNHACIGLLTQQVRSVFLVDKSPSLVAVRCDFTDAGRSVQTWPIGPINPVIHQAHTIQIGACVASRWPGYFEPEDALVLGGTTLGDAGTTQPVDSAIEVHIPKTPAGDAWHREIPTPVASEPAWSHITHITSVITPDPHGCCAVITPGGVDLDPIDMKNWVISKDVLYQGLPMPALPTPSGAGPVYDNPPQAVWMPPSGQQPGQWHWLQVVCIDSVDFLTSLCESQSTELIDPQATAEWVIGATNFHAVARPNPENGTTALTVLCFSAKSGLYLGTKNPASGIWTYVAIS